MNKITLIRFLSHVGCEMVQLCLKIFGSHHVYLFHEFPIFSLVFHFWWCLFVDEVINHPQPPALLGGAQGLQPSLCGAAKVDPRWWCQWWYIIWWHIYIYIYNIYICIMCSMYEMSRVFYIYIISICYTRMYKRVSIRHPLRGVTIRHPLIFKVPN